MGHIVIHIKEEQSWHNERSKGIGGSDASILLGINKWKSELELWLEKTGQSLECEVRIVPFEDKES